MSVNQGAEGQAVLPASAANEQRESTRHIKEIRFLESTFQQHLSLYQVLIFELFEVNFILNI